MYTSGRNRYEKQSCFCVAIFSFIGVNSANDKEVVSAREATSFVILKL